MDRQEDIKGLTMGLYKDLRRGGASPMKFEEIQLNVDRMLQAIYERAKDYEWDYYQIYGVLCDRHESSHRNGDYHVHFVIYGKPADTIAKEMMLYWKRKELGNKRHIQLDTNINMGWYDYVKRNRDNAEHRVKKYNRVYKMRRMERPEWEDLFNKLNKIYIPRKKTENNGAYNVSVMKTVPQIEIDESAALNIFG
mgnify:FL=1